MERSAEVSEATRSNPFPNAAHRTHVPPDTFVAGGEEGALLHIRPIAPVKADTLRFEVEWPSSGEPVITDHHIKKHKDGTRITFTYARRTDVNVVARSWTERLMFLELPNRYPGRCILCQERGGQWNARDVDPLLGR